MTHADPHSTLHRSTALASNASQHNTHTPLLPGPNTHLRARARPCGRGDGPWRAVGAAGRALERRAPREAQLAVGAAGSGGRRRIRVRPGATDHTRCGAHRGARDRPRGTQGAHGRAWLVRCGPWRAWLAAQAPSGGSWRWIAVVARAACTANWRRKCGGDGPCSTRHARSVGGVTDGAPRARRTRSCAEGG